MKTLQFFLLTLLVCFTFGCSQGPDVANTADTIYFGGDIVTVNDAQPSAPAS